MVPFLSVAREGSLGSLGVESAKKEKENERCDKEIGAPEYRIRKFQWNFVLTPRETMISDPVLGPVVTARK